MRPLALLLALPLCASLLACRQQPAAVTVDDIWKAVEVTPSFERCQGEDCTVVTQVPPEVIRARLHMPAFSASDDELVSMAGPYRVDLKAEAGMWLAHFYKTQPPAQ